MAKKRPRLASLQHLLQLRWLLSSGERYSLDDLGDQLGIRRRTLQRYLAVLRESVTVHEELEGGRKLLWIEPVDRTPRARLGRGPLISLAVARRLMSGYAGTGLPESFDRALASLAPFAEPPAAELAKKLDAKILVLGHGWFDFSSREDDFDQMLSALIHEQRISARHRSVDRGSTSFRIDPYLMVLSEKGVQLAGWSHHHGALRMFDFDGLHRVRWLRKETVSICSDLAPEALVRRALGMMSLHPAQPGSSPDHTRR